METDKKTILLLLIIGVLGIGLIGVGITGKVIMNDELYQELCAGDNECSPPNICCRFYQENSGVCNSASMCENIKQLTLKEKSALNKWKNFKIEDPRFNLYNSEVILGIILLMIIIIAVYIIIKKNKL